jgi:transposase
MSKSEWKAKRTTAIHLLRSGDSPQEVAKEIGCSVSWVYKWQKRFEEEGWEGMAGHSRAPHQVANRLPERVRRAILQTRSELEAEAETAGSGKLRYVGAGAVQARLKEKGIEPLPGTASIERVLSTAGMTRPRKKPTVEKVHYPHLRPTEPHELCQVDIVPHFLKGGQPIACFNGIDVVSRYPAGRQSLTKRSRDAMQSLLDIWQETGIPLYTQLDNEACFSGGFTHPGVLGKTLRLCLYVGTELVFSPVRNPESNGYVERFHQDYDLHVWDDTDLADLADVHSHSHPFYRAYRHSRHHSALQGRSPSELHTRNPKLKLPSGFSLPEGKLPLTEGKAHFIRLVRPQGSVSVLNMDWDVPSTRSGQGVWATLEFTLQKATLRIYDAAPDAPIRTCLAEHPFPLKEKVHPLRPEFHRRPPHRIAVSQWLGVAMRGVAAQVGRGLAFYDVLMAYSSVNVR